MPLGWSLAAVPLLIALNAFFVAAEYALVAIRTPHIDALARRGRRASAAAMTRLKADPAGWYKANRVTPPAWFGEAAGVGKKAEILREARKAQVKAEHSANRWALDHLVHGTPLDDLDAAPFDWREGWQYRL